MSVHQMFTRFVNGGSPIRCSYCEEKFDGTAYRGDNGKYYCSQLCRDADSPTVEDFARRVN